MSGKPGPKRRAGISRRDFVQGRFWRALGKTGGNRESAVDATTETTKRPPRRSLVMRYPKSLREVSAADPPENAKLDSAAVPVKIARDVAARRRTIPVLRPPGAIDEESFLAVCTRCNRCAEACPHDAIIPAPVRLREAVGTPMIDPDHQPCLMCDDYPCIAACDVNVLTHLVPKMMGTAKVTEHLCLAHHGTTCTVCSERCPVEGVIDVTDGKPTIIEASCTGCGVCRYVCPAPENAILLMPAFLRPSPHSRSTT